MVPDVNKIHATSFSLLSTEFMEFELPISSSRMFEILIISISSSISLKIISARSWNESVTIMALDSVDSIMNLIRASGWFSSIGTYVAPIDNAAKLDKST